MSSFVWLTFFPLNMNVPECKPQSVQRFFWAARTFCWFQFEQEGWCSKAAGESSPEADTVQFSASPAGGSHIQTAASLLHQSANDRKKFVLSHFVNVFSLKRSFCFVFLRPHLFFKLLFLFSEDVCYPLVKILFALLHWRRDVKGESCCQLHRCNIIFCYFNC